MLRDVATRDTAPHKSQASSAEPLRMIVGGSTCTFGMAAEQSTCFEHWQRRSHDAVRLLGEQIYRAARSGCD